MFMNIQLQYLNSKIIQTSKQSQEKSFSFSFKTVSLIGKEKEIKCLNMNKVFIPSH